MNDSDLERFAGIIGALTRTFDREADEALLFGFKMGLEDLSIESIESAVATAMRTCEHMPNVATLRRLTGEATTDDRAILAWAAFERAVVREGAYASVEFDDPVIHATIRNHGGWQRCCGLPCEEFDKWLRKDFLATYSALCSTGISREAGAPLIGICEASNRMNGFQEAVKAPRLITTGLPAHKNLRILGGPSPQPALLGHDTIALNAEIGKE
jgi:hypothetical protein